MQRIQRFSRGPRILVRFYCSDKSPICGVWRFRQFEWSADNQLFSTAQWHGPGANDTDSCGRNTTANATAMIPNLAVARVVRTTFASIGRTMKTFGMVSSYSCICCLVRAHSRRRRYVFAVQMPFGEVVHNKIVRQASRREPKPTNTHTPLTRIVSNENTFTLAAQRARIYTHIYIPFNLIRKLVWSAQKLYVRSKLACYKLSWQIWKEGSVQYKPAGEWRHSSAHQMVCIGESKLRSPNKTFFGMLYAAHCTHRYMPARCWMVPPLRPSSFNFSSNRM